MSKIKGTRLGVEVSSPIVSIGFGGNVTVSVYGCCGYEFEAVPGLK